MFIAEAAMRQGVAGISIREGQALQEAGAAQHTTTEALCQAEAIQHQADLHQAQGVQVLFLHQAGVHHQAVRLAVAAEAQAPAVVRAVVAGDKIC